MISNTSMISNTTMISNIAMISNTIMINNAIMILVIPIARLGKLSMNITMIAIMITMCINSPNPIPGIRKESTKDNATAPTAVRKSLGAGDRLLRGVASSVLLLRGASSVLHSETSDGRLA